MEIPEIQGYPPMATRSYQPPSDTITHWRWGLCFRNLAAKGYRCWKDSPATHDLCPTDWPIPQRSNLGLLEETLGRFWPWCNWLAKFIKILHSYGPPISWWITFSISGHAHLKQFKCGLNMILHRTVLQVSYAYTHKPRMNYGEKNPLWNVLESSSQVQKQLLHIGQPKSYRSSSKITSHSHSRCSRPAFTCRRRSNQCSISQEAPGHVYRFTLDQWREDPVKRTRDSFCMTRMFFQSCFIATSQHAAKFQGVHTKRQKGEKWIWPPQEVYLDKPSQEKYTGCVRPYI